MKGVEGNGESPGGRRAAWKVWGPAVVWSAVLFLLSEISEFPTSFEWPHIDKVVHFVLYFVLGMTLAWGRVSADVPRPHWLLVLVGWSLGAADEMHQSLVPGRTPEWADLGVDALGVTMGYVLFVYLARTLTGHRHHERGS